MDCNILQTGVRVKWGEEIFSESEILSVLRLIVSLAWKSLFFALLPKR
jgi:hypothetical protein